MIYPIIAYGDPVLKKVAEDISQDYPDLQQLIADMYETMYEAGGIGLAAPQIGKSIRLFIVDTAPLERKDVPEFKKVFINASILEEYGDDWKYDEGCLSIPGVRGEVSRPSKLKIHYFDENWKEHTEELDGMPARIIQHEYDHIEGILFVEHLSSLKRQLIKGKLSNLSKGYTDAQYRMKFYHQDKRR